MLQCWNEVPHMRPSFRLLVAMITDVMRTPSSLTSARAQDPRLEESDYLEPRTSDSSNLCNDAQSVGSDTVKERSYLALGDNSGHAGQADVVFDCGDDELSVTSPEVTEKRDENCVEAGANFDEVVRVEHLP